MICVRMDIQGSGFMSQPHKCVQSLKYCIIDARCALTGALAIWHITKMNYTSFLCVSFPSRPANGVPTAQRVNASLRQLTVLRRTTVPWIHNVR